MKNLQELTQFWKKSADKELTLYSLSVLKEFNIKDYSDYEYMVTILEINNQEFDLIRLNMAFGFLYYKKSVRDAIFMFPFSIN